MLGYYQWRRRSSLGRKPLTRFRRFVQRLTVDELSRDTLLKDAPPSFRLNAASCKLAPVLYESHCELWRGAVPDAWSTLHPAIKQAWISRAATAIKGVR